MLPWRGVRRVFQASIRASARQRRSSMIGSRWITTFRKLPTSSENTKALPVSSAWFVEAARPVRQTTAPSLKIGRYIATTMPPTSTPRITMMSGSSRLDSASTAASTSAS